MNKISRKQARLDGLQYYFTGKPCKKGHVSQRYTTNSSCVECMKDLSQKHYEDNKVQILKQHKEWNKNNLERKRELGKDAYYRMRINNNEALLNGSRRYRKNNVEKIAEREKLNRGYRKHIVGKRRAAKKQATVEWANLDAIKLIYERATVLTEELGITMHVDHIIPLQNELVCGLHCEDNLQIITAQENLKKGNRLC